MRSDIEIASNIANILKWHVPVEEEEINITVDKGVVTLEGLVARDFQRQAIEEAVRCHPDVRRLDNFIGLKPRTISALRISKAGFPAWEDRQS